MKKIFNVDKDFNNSRFDKWFKSEVLDIPHSLIEKLIRKKNIKVNHKKTKTSYRVKLNDIVEIHGLDGFKKNIKKKRSIYKASAIDKKKYDSFVIENNENFLVINKPAGIPIQPGTKSHKNILDLLKGTKYFFDRSPYIVHRLDKETSGILIIAKNREYAQLITSLFRIRKIHKTYHAIVNGKIPFNKKTLIDNLIYYENNKKITQKAISHIKLIKTKNDFSFLELNPISGRKHQLRKQLLNIGFSIVGDKKYSIEKTNKKENLMLHAKKIKFMINDIKYNFEADYPNEFLNFLKTKIKSH